MSGSYQKKKFGSKQATIIFVRIVATAMARPWRRLPSNVEGICGQSIRLFRTGHRKCSGVRIDSLYVERRLFIQAKAIKEK